MKKVLFILRFAPHSGVQLQEKLDIILTAAAFDQNVALLFLDDGVFQLKKGQKPDAQGLKDTASIFNALKMYDVDDLYIEKESLQERGLELNELNLPIKPYDRCDINGLIRQHDVVW